MADAGQHRAHDPLTTESVSRIHFRGGSHIGISRANPTLDPEHLEQTVISLLRLNVSQLITIGGDDTAYSAMKLEQKSQGRIRVVHVPKTIDNDLDLPHYVDTFGFQTARHHGVEIVKNLMVDAKTTSRWYFVIAMGRKAGHLALGMGKAAGATLTMIPEEFPGQTVRLKTLVDTLAGAIIKRLSYGRREGVAIIAEGLALHIDPADLAQLEDVERDDHGNVRIAEVNIGEILKQEVSNRLKQFGLKATLVAKNIGYELRCADPVPADMEYTRDLGYCAAKYLLSGGNGVDDLDAGRPLRADSLRAAARPDDRARAHPHGRHPLDAVRDRAALHDPAAARRLQRSARAREVRGHGGAVAAGVPQGVRVPRATTSRRRWSSTRSSASSNRGRITRIPRQP